MILKERRKRKTEKKKFDQAAYISEFKKKTYKYIGLQLNRNTEADLIHHVEKQENKNEYIKALIREDMKKTK